MNGEFRLQNGEGLEGGLEFCLIVEGGAALAARMGRGDLRFDRVWAQGLLSARRHYCDLTTDTPRVYGYKRTPTCTRTRTAIGLQGGITHE